MLLRGGPHLLQAGGHDEGDPQFVPVLGLPAGHLGDEHRARPAARRDEEEHQRQPRLEQRGHGHLAAGGVADRHVGRGGADRQRLGRRLGGEAQMLLHGGQAREHPAVLAQEPEVQPQRAGQQRQQDHTPDHQE